MSNLNLKKSTAISSVIVIAVVCFGLGFLTSNLVKSNGLPGAAGQPSFNGASGFGQGGAGSQNGMRGQQAGGAARMRGAGFVSGTLLKKDASTMTVKLRDGSTKLILVTSSTKAMKMADTTLDQFTDGSDVMISGTTNSDGSVTAQTVQVRPTPPAGEQPPQPTAQPQK